MFLAKFIFKLYMHGSDRTVVIKIPLVREVMPKGDLAAFLRSRDERRDEQRSSCRTRSTLAASSRLASGSSPSRRSAIRGLNEVQSEEEAEEAPGTAGAVPREGPRELQYSLSTYQEEQEDTAHALDPPPDER